MCCSDLPEGDLNVINVKNKGTRLEIGDNIFLGKIARNHENNIVIEVFMGHKKNFTILIDFAATLWSNAPVVTLQKWGGENSYAKLICFCVVFLLMFLP